MTAQTDFISKNRAPNRTGELSTSDLLWQRSAVRFAQLKISFTVTGFNPSLDSTFCNAIKEKYDLDVVMDAASGRVVFKSKSAI